jgi:hypothetical protein
MRGDSPTDKYKIKVIRSAPIPTNSLCVQLKKYGGQVYIDTAYPGIFGVDIPNGDNQTKEEFEYNKLFWESNVFLRE